MNADDYTPRLAATLMQAAENRHPPERPWRHFEGQYAFDVEIAGTAPEGCACLR